MSNNDNVLISGFSTSNLSVLNDSFKVNVPFISNAGLTAEVASSGAATTEIYVTQIPAGVSAGSSIGIGTETLEVLNVYPDKSIFRVKRGHSWDCTYRIGAAVSFKPKTFTIDQNVDYFESKVNNRMYFNPQESVGFGTTAGTGHECIIFFWSGGNYQDLFLHKELVLKIIFFKLIKNLHLVKMAIMPFQFQHLLQEPHLIFQQQNQYMLSISLQALLG